MRFHTHLPVNDLEKTQAFYQALLGVPPTKEKTDYLKFLTPQLNLAFSPGAVSGVVDVHLGFEFPNHDELHDAEQRLREAGIPIPGRDDSVCCYAAQDKLRVTDPNGYEWELYVLVADTAHRADADSPCCPEPAASTAAS